MAALIPFDDRDGFIWFDGRLIPWREAAIHVLSHGLHYASCVFEGERSYNGAIFRSEDHSKRLIDSAKILYMDLPFTVQQLEQAKLDVLRANNIRDGYIRPVAWRGSEQMGLAVGQTKVHVAVAAWEWPSYFPPEVLEKGISLKTAKWRKPAADTAPTRSKAAGLYMIGTISKYEAEQAGYTDALMLDYRGRVAEASGANIFVVQDGVLKTPIADCFLNGLTRQTVIALARDLRIPFEETVIMPQDLEKAQEVFVTGTAAEVTAVGKIDNLTFTVGPVTRQLRQAYNDLVRGAGKLAAAE